MSHAVRLATFTASAAVLALCFAMGVSGLAPIGTHRTTYAEVIEAVGVEQRHAPNLVTAVTFDYRAIDTLIEEVILFAAVMGTSILLRAAWTEEKRPVSTEALEAEDVPDESDAVTATGLVGGGALFTFGAMIVAHAQLTPGGGFQGGVVLAGALFMVYLGRDYEAFCRAVRPEQLARVEAFCVFAFLALGFAGTVFADAFLENFLPLGVTGELFSSGLIAVLNAVTGASVFTGVGLLFGEFLEQTLILREGKRWP
jgi:multicomponent Na+:H+ antiporter subunit B